MKLVNSEQSAAKTNSTLRNHDLLRRRGRTSPLHVIFLQ